MKTAFIVHGAYGNPEENWFPWMRDQLIEKGYKVVAPMFPTPVGQNFDNWTEVFAPYMDSLDEESILIGHSIGATFLLSILEFADKQVAKTILVSGFIGTLNEPEFDDINKTIAGRNFNWELIRANSKEFHMLHGENDPYVSNAKSQELADILGVDVEMIPNGGHINESFGFTELPQALSRV